MSGNVNAGSQPLHPDIAKLTDDEWKLYIKRSKEFTREMLKMLPKMIETLAKMTEGM